MCSKSRMGMKSIANSNVIINSQLLKTLQFRAPIHRYIKEIKYMS